MAEYGPPGRAIVSVWHQEVGGGGTFLGSGAFVSPRHVLTAQHVVDEDRHHDGFHLGLVDGYPTVPAKTIQAHPDYDIALIDLEKEFSGQGLVRPSWESTDLKGKKVDFYGINRFNKARDENKDHTVGTWHSELNGYLCDHQVLKGFSGGVAVVDGCAVGVIIKRHESEQQTLFIPLYLAYEWIAKILLDATPKRYFPTSPSKRRIRPEQAPTEFTQQVRREIGRLLGRHKLRPLHTTILGRCPEDRRQEAKPESLLVPLEASVSVESSVRLLHSTTGECLRQLSDQDSKAVPDVIAGATDVLGWLVLLAVSEDWFQKNAEPCEQLLKAEYIEIPLKTEVGTEVVIARLREHPAQFSPDENRIGVNGTYRIAVDQLELGYGQNSVLNELKKLIWSAVFKDPNPPDPLEGEDEVKLDLTLQYRDEDGEHYYIIVPSRYSAAVNDVVVFAELSRSLPYLGAFRIGAENSDDLLVIEEPRFVVLVQEFFRMLRKYP